MSNGSTKFDLIKSIKNFLTFYEENNEFPIEYLLNNN